MATRTTEAGATWPRAAAAAVFACLLAALAALGAASSSDAARANEIGKTANTPPPSCPTPKGNDFPARKGCQVLGEVTAFQVRADGKKGLMKVPANGHIVGWAVDLARPNKEERAFFKDVLGDRAFNGKASARIAVVSHSEGKRFRLRAEGPVVKLNSLFGRRQYFTLNNPIPVNKGWIAALTTQTWIPNFAHDLPGDGNTWRASRVQKRCEGFNNLTKRSKPHRDVGTNKIYGCVYRDARPLYWAYFVKE